MEIIGNLVHILMGKKLVNGDLIIIGNKLYLKENMKMVYQLVSICFGIKTVR